MAKADCRCDTLDFKFEEAYAAEKLALYRSIGPDPSTRMLIDMITSENIRGKTLLDIGGGVGAVQHELLKLGIVSAQEVEASIAYVEACRQEANRQGHGDRITHLRGDFGSLTDDIVPADIVTLDRSLCCWRDPLTLVDESAAKTRWLYGIVYPRDVWWVRHGWRHFSNVRQISKRSGLRLSTPRRADVEGILARRGLRRRRDAAIGVWQISLYSKGAS